MPSTGAGVHRPGSARALDSLRQSAPTGVTGGSRPAGPGLLERPPRVLNVGLPGFADDAETETEVLRVDWRPPARGDERLARLLGALERERAETIETANAEVLARLMQGEPLLVDVRRAAEVIPALADPRARRVLHAGPPLEWARMCGPMRGAIAGAAVLEGWADDLEAAARLAAEGAFEFAPNHDHGAVGPMTGITTASQPVLVVENQAFGNRAFCTLNEGLGRVMRFGGNDPEVLARLRWIAAVLGPALARALTAHGAVRLKGIVARGLTMGDEMHQRNAACTSLLIRELAAPLARSSPSEIAGAVLEFMAGNDQLFLNVAMAIGKSMTDAVAHVPGSSIVTAMSRNGTDFGIRLAGTGAQWFVAPVEMPRGLYFPGFGPDDANPDMGDSTIVETIGLGGFAMAASPAVAGFVGAGGAAEAVRCTRSMQDITATENPAWTIPALGFSGVPTGIDARLVVHTGIVPTINTGIAHREPGVGQVGAGVVQAPYACFARGLVGLAQALEVDPS